MKKIYIKMEEVMKIDQMDEFFGDMKRRYLLKFRICSNKLTIFYHQIIIIFNKEFVGCSSRLQVATF